MQQLLHPKCDGLWMAFLALRVAQLIESISDGALLYHCFPEIFFNYLLKRASGLKEVKQKETVQLNSSF